MGASVLAELGDRFDSVILYGLADYRLQKYGQVIDLYGSRAEAEAVLREVLRDEPEWVGELGVVVIEFPFAVQ